ncbi:MAG: DUF2974 domain-containing protein [Clostridia bacterium]|nr:DUF2974 domain-containing protein [Clostridia bacterium]
MMTPRDLALINRLIYYDPPDNTLKRIGCCLSAGMMAEEIIAHPPQCADFTRDDADSLKPVLSNCAIRDLIIAGYINHNDSNGFVAFAFEGGDETVLAFRGSESAPGCVVSNVDWVDNILSPFNRSIQYRDVERFINNYKVGPLVTTGHSKGGHNALYSIAVAENESARCVAFDAQGFSSGQLDSRQKRRLKHRCVNYVYRRDVVGALLCHPEKRVFVKGSKLVDPHSLDALAFDVNGDPIAAKQAVIPHLIGLGTCALPLPLFDTRQAQPE